MATKFFCQLVSRSGFIPGFKVVSCPLAAPAVSCPVSCPVFGPRFQGWFHGSLLSPGFMPGFKAGFMVGFNPGFKAVSMVAVIVLLLAQPLFLSLPLLVFACLGLLCFAYLLLV